MLKKILYFLFPRTIDKIINTSLEEANIIHEYGSMENYYQAMDELNESIELEQQKIDAEIETNKQFDEFLKSTNNDKVS